MFQPKVKDQVSEDNIKQNLDSGDKIFNGNSFIDNSDKKNIETKVNTITNNDENIYYMPDKFLKPQNENQKGKNWFLIVGIILLVVVVLAVGFFAFYVFNKNKESQLTKNNLLNLPPKNISSNEKEGSKVVKVEEEKLDTPKLRDQKRIKDILNIRSSLSIYYKDNEKYPSNLNNINKYLKSFPVNPTPGGEANYYQAQNSSQDYILTFVLEYGGDFGNLILKNGKYQLTSSFGLEVYQEEINNEDSVVEVENDDIKNDDNKSALTPLLGEDADGDKLSNAEELMYGTEINSEDTDGDGYLDGYEIYSLYDPLQISSKLSDNTELVRYYNNDEYKYSVLYPSKWVAESKTANMNEVIFYNNEQDDFFQIQVNDNPQGLTLRNWYLGLADGVNPIDLKNFSNKNVFGISTKDGLNIYLAQENKIFIISYIIRNMETMEYFRTFEMLTQSFKFLDNIETEVLEKNVNEIEGEDIKNEE